MFYLSLLLQCVRIEERFTFLSAVDDRHNSFDILCAIYQRDCTRR